MPFLPQVVGEVHVRQRKPRYKGEPTYKTLSFVRPKTTKTESLEIVRVLPSRQFNFWDHPYWHTLTREHQIMLWEEYQRTGAQPSWQNATAPAEHHHHHHIPPPPALGHHHHQLPSRLHLPAEPEIKLIKPKEKPKKPDTGHDIFDESDSETIYSGSSRMSFGSSKSSRSSSSSNSRSSGSSRIKPVRGW